MGTDTTTEQSDVWALAMVMFEVRVSSFTISAVISDCWSRCSLTQDGHSTNALLRIAQLPKHHYSDRAGAKAGKTRRGCVGARIHGRTVGAYAILLGT